MQPERKSAVLMVRLRPSTKAAAERAAAADDRSLSSLVERLLLDHLGAKGFLPPREPTDGPGT